MAHQRTAQISSANVLDALANCAVRYANSDDEARWLAPRLRTTESFLQSLKVGTFAAYVRDMTPHALALTVTPVTFGEKLTADEESKLKERMRAEYGVPAALPISESAVPPPASERALLPARAGKRKRAKPSPAPTTEGASDWRG
jgi:hypothetical protein